MSGSFKRRRCFKVGKIRMERKVQEEREKKGY
jgi:hypothetical protein